MQNKTRLIIVVICVFITSFVVVQTAAYFFAQTHSKENIFKTGEWVSAQTLFTLKHQNQDYFDAEKISSYIDPNGEHFQLTIKEGQNQFLSFMYKLETEETAQNFDLPVVIVFANQIPLLQLALTEYDDKWHEAYIDLNKSGLDPGVYDLFFVTQNTYDDQFLPNLSVKEVTTTKLFPNLDSMFQFTASKEVQLMTVSYKVQENEEQVVVEQNLGVQIIDEKQIFEFLVPENFYGNEFSFWSTDLFNNIEPKQYVYLHKPGNLSVLVHESKVFTQSDHELYVQLQFQNNGETAKFFDARFSLDLINTEQDWIGAEKLTQKQFQQFFKAKVPTVYTKGLVVRNLVFQDFPEGKYYFSMKLCDSSLVCENVLQNQVVESYL